MFTVLFRKVKSKSYESVTFDNLENAQSYARFLSKKAHIADAFVEAKVELKPAIEGNSNFTVDTIQLIHWS